MILQPTPDGACSIAYDGACKAPPVLTDGLPALLSVAHSPGENSFTAYWSTTVSYPDQYVTMYYREEGSLEPQQRVVVPRDDGQLTSALNLSDGALYLYSLVVHTDDERNAPELREVRILVGSSLTGQDDQILTGQEGSVLIQ